MLVAYGVAAKIENPSALLSNDFLGSVHQDSSTNLSKICFLYIGSPMPSPGLSKFGRFNGSRFCISARKLVQKSVQCWPFELHAIDHG